ncbi:MAG: glycosyltransferase family 39 protein [Nitrospira sp.]|nr:glycosyltransferase family 39 protein [Nitrospira sp.]MDH4370414.1 glycosyltransferase family 39 protein [Nitrospira sp.]MDH5496090.1 glycosyltransferase family 39 protein [Nitrospira sp.]
MSRSWSTQLPQAGMILLPAIGLGLLARVWVIWKAPNQSFAVDQLFDTLAWNLVSLRQFTLDGANPAAHVGPLYPAVLAGFYFIIGHRPEWVPTLHILFDLCAAWGIYRVGSILWNPRVGAWTAALLFLYPAYWTYDQRIRSEALLTFLISLWLWVTVLAMKSPSTPRFAIMGLVAGLTVLCKPAVLVLAVLLATLTGMGTDRISRKLVYGIVYGTACLALVLPWSVRNYTEFHHIIPVSAGVGVGLWMGSDPASRGSWPMPLEREYAIWESAGLTPLPHAYAMYEVQTDRLLRQKGIERIMSDPLSYLSLTLGRVWDFWVGNSFYLFEEQQGVTLGFSNDVQARGWVVAFYSLFKRLVLVPTLIIVACYSAWIHRDRWKTLLPLYLFPIGLTVGYVPFTVEAGRYALPVLPCLMMLSVAAVHHLHIIQLFFRKRRIAPGMTGI